MTDVSPSEKCKILVVAGASGSGKTAFIDRLIKGGEETRLGGLNLKYFKGWKLATSKKFPMVNEKKSLE